MNEYAKIFIAFVVGTIAGAAVTQKCLTTKYDQREKEEIESIKRAFYEMEQLREEENFNKLDESGGDTNELETYSDVIVENNYTNKKGEEVVRDTKSGPYVITPDEFGEFYDYAEISLTYYNDGILADENDDIIEDDEEIDELVGQDFAQHFGEYEDDSVFIRNDELKVDYEILRDYRDYHKVFPNASVEGD